MGKTHRGKNKHQSLGTTKGLDRDYAYDEQGLTDRPAYGLQTVGRLDIEPEMVANLSRGYRGTGNEVVLDKHREQLQVKMEKQLVKTNNWKSMVVRERIENMSETLTKPKIGEFKYITNGIVFKDESGTRTINVKPPPPGGRSGLIPRSAMRGDEPNPVGNRAFRRQLAKGDPNNPPVKRPVVSHDGLVIIFGKEQAWAEHDYEFGPFPNTLPKATTKEQWGASRTEFRVVWDYKVVSKKRLIAAYLQPYPVEKRGNIRSTFFVLGD